MKRFVQKSVALIGLAVFSSGSPAAAHQERPPLDLKAVVLTAELFTAIRLGDKRAVIAALDHGADPNRPNWLDLTPLDWTMLLKRGNLADVLVSRGAKPSGGTYGSPVVGAAMLGLEKEALMLLEKGVDATSKRLDKATVLMLAAAYGAPKVIERLKPDAAELARQDIDGATALIYAARLGQLEATRLLLAQGAQVDGTDNHGRTPLMYAALNGYKAVVDALLAAGAQPNQLDQEKASALHLATRYSGDKSVVQSLLKAKARFDLADAAGKTPLTLARARGFTACATTLEAAGATAPASLPMITPTQAVQRSVASLQKSMKSFLTQSECASCHHQGIGLATLGRARLKGFVVDQGIVDGNLKRVADNLQQAQPLVELALHDPKMSGVVPMSEMEEMTIGSAYFFWAMAENNAKPTPTLTTLAQYLATLQQPGGSWHFTVHRGPMQESQHTATAFQVLGMRRYLPPAESTPRLKKAQAWLRSAPVVSTEDVASRLLGLHWSGLSASTLQQEAKALVALQHADGGWGSKVGAPSNALSTGLALYSLKVAGALPTTHPTVHKAAQYLIRMQDEKGSWYLNKTVAPLNFFFDAAFPSGESQYSSFAATGWATLALLEVADRPRVARH